MWISPSYQETDFKQPLSIDDKITLFEDRVSGWKLNIADYLINGAKTIEGHSIKEPIPHSGYAVLDIVFSYFEMIAKYENGYVGNRKSKEYFLKGIYSVFPSLGQASSKTPFPGGSVDFKQIIDDILGLLYDGVRCGLYHNGITQGRVMVTGGIDVPLGYHVESTTLILNPHLLPGALKAHFLGYVSRLRNPNNHEFRSNFNTRFDYETIVQDRHP